MGDNLIIRDFAYAQSDDRYKGLHSNLRPSIKTMLYDFEPLNESELGVHEGDLVFVISEFSEGWVVARRVEEFNNKDDYKLQEIEGIIPFSYIDWNSDLQFSLE